MAGRVQWEAQVDSNIKQLLGDAKQLRDELDGIKKRKYEVKLNIDEKKLENVISNLDKMLASLGKGTGDFKEFENLSKLLNDIVSEVQLLNKAFGGINDKGVSNLLSSINNIDKSLSTLNEHIIATNKDFGNVGNNASKNVDQINEARKATEGLADATKDLKNAQKDVGNKSNISSESVDNNNLKNKNQLINDIGKSYFDLLNKINSENSAIKEGNKFLGERIVLLKNNTIVDGYLGERKHVNGNFGTQNGDKIVHTHSEDISGESLSSSDMYSFVNNYLNNKVNEFELIWRNQILNIKLPNNLSENDLSYLSNSYEALYNAVVAQLGRGLENVPEDVATYFGKYVNSFLENILNNIGGSLTLSQIDTEGIIKQIELPKLNKEEYESIYSTLISIKDVDFSSDYIKQIQDILSVTRPLVENVDTLYNSILYLYNLKDKSDISANIKHIMPFLDENDVKDLSNILSDNLTDTDLKALADAVYNQLYIPFKQSREEALSVINVIQEIGKLSNTASPIKDVIHGDTDKMGMDGIVSSTEDVVQAKKDFATANEGVQSSIDGSKSPLQLEAELMSNIAQSAREAADAKKEFVEANKEVKDGTDSSNNSLKKDKYKDRSKISEDDYTSRSDYFASIANKKLTDSGNTILGNNVNTELVDGLVKVNAKIKEADGTWKTFSAKIDADGNMFEQRFRTITKNVDKLDKELKDFELDSSPALSYGETLEKAKQIRESLNLGDEFTVKVDSNELVTITKKLDDVNSSAISVTQTFKSAQDAIDNFGKETSNVAEKTSVALKNIKEKKDNVTSNTQSQKDDAQETQLSSAEESLNKFQSKLSSLKLKPDEEHRFPKYTEYINQLDNAIKEYSDHLTLLRNKQNNGGIITDEDIQDVKTYENKITDLFQQIKKFSGGEKGYENISATKVAAQINKLLEDNTRMSQEAKDKIKEYYAEVSKGNPTRPLKEIYNDALKVVQAEKEMGRGGKSFLSAIKDKVWYGAAGQIANMFSIYDAINIGRQGFDVIRELDTSITEMRKVSDETINSLKNYQATTFDTANAVGTTAKQIQDSTADWMRLGESMDQAAESAKVSNVLLNVSEFDSIDSATESLVAMSQAYQDLSKMDIVDVLNNIGKILPKHMVTYGDVKSWKVAITVKGVWER